MTKPHAIESARQNRAAHGGTWYVIVAKSSARLPQFTVIPSKLYRRKVHGPVAAIVATA